MHAMYRAFLNKKQTVLLSPLVVLAYEHFETVVGRMKSCGARVALLTRLSTSKEERQVLQ